MIDMKCKKCHARFTRRLKSCPICGGNLELKLDHVYTRSSKINATVA